jgi:hypothetical protein
LELGAWDLTHFTINQPGPACVIRMTWPAVTRHNAGEWPGKP